MPRLVAVIGAFCIYVFIISLLSNHWRGIELTFLDIILFLKPFVIYIILLSIKPQLVVHAGDFFSKIAILYFFSALLFLPIFHIFQLNPGVHDRFGISSYSFFSTNPGAFLNSILIAFVLSYLKYKNIRPLLLLCLFILALSTLRFKGFVILGIVSSLYVAFAINWKNSSGNFGTVYMMKRLPIYFPFILIAIFLGWNQFQFYFNSDLTPRLIMTIEGWKIFLDYFPLGSGAGSYGSSIASMYYSPIYKDLGFNNFYGLSGQDDDRNFLNDQFWPLVIAQYGFFGLLFVLYFFIAIFKNSIEGIQRSKDGIFANYLIVSNIVLSTIGSSIILGFWGIIFSFLLVFVKYKFNE